MVKRGSSPDKGLWSLPGGIIDLDSDEDIQACAYRKLKIKTGLTPPI